MFTDKELQTFLMCVVVYLVFFSYMLTRNPVLECVMTILLMVVVAVTSHATAKAEAEEKHRQEQELRYEIYDGMDDKEEEEDEEEEEEEKVPAGYIDVAEFEAAKGLVSLTTMPEAKTSEAVDTLPRTQEEISAARDKALQQLREVERASASTSIPVPISVKDRVRAIDLSGVVQDLSGAFADAPLVPRVGSIQ